MGYLVETTEMYRLATEQEVKEFLEELKKSGDFTLTKYASEKKQTKAKGEVVDEWYRLKVTKHFNNEKEPLQEVKIIYEYC